MLGTIHGLWLGAKLVTAAVGRIGKAPSTASMALGDFRVSIIGPDRQWSHHFLADSPYYQALVQDDPEIYESYRRRLIAFAPYLAPYQIGWPEYQLLCVSLRRGILFDRRWPVVIRDSVIQDGQHRLSALLWMHGSDAQVSLVEKPVRIVPPCQMVVSLLGTPAWVASSLHV